MNLCASDALDWIVKKRVNLITGGKRDSGHGSSDNKYSLYYKFLFSYSLLWQTHLISCHAVR